MIQLTAEDIFESLSLQKFWSSMAKSIYIGVKKMCEKFFALSINLLSWASYLNYVYAEKTSSMLGFQSNMIYACALVYKMV